MNSCARASGIVSCAAIVVVACAASTAAAPEVERAPDPICQALFQEYIVRSGKIPGEDVLAASELIVSRGRTTGFWSSVLEGLRAVKGWDEMRYVRILGLMLAQDAGARDAIQSGDAEEMQQPPTIALPKEVVPELVGRGEKADEYVADAYTVALARARDPRAKEFFLRMLKPDSRGANWSSVRFHAALGLAELGEAAGVEWLIAHSDDDSPGIVWGRPLLASRQRLGSSVLVALQVLSGQPALKTKAEFEAWWRTAAATWTPQHHVYLADR